MSILVGVIVGMGISLPILLWLEHLKTKRFNSAMRRIRGQ